MNSPYLIDTSSLLFLVRSERENRKVDIIKESKILDLTYYEIGNAVWKESELLKTLPKNELDLVIDAFVKTLEITETVRVSKSDFVDVLILAKTEGLTFYDASYLNVASMNGMTLVTEDQKLQQIGRKYVRVRSIHSLI